MYRSTGPADTPEPPAANTPAIVMPDAPAAPRADAPRALWVPATAAAAPQRAPRVPQPGGRPAKSGLEIVALPFELALITVLAPLRWVVGPGRRR